MALVCILCTVTGLCGCSSTTIDFTGVSGTDIDYGDSTKYGTYYDQLNDFQKKLYVALLEPISKAEAKIELKNINAVDMKRDCFAVTTAIQYDHPEYFWFTGGYAYSGSKEPFAENADFTLEPTYYSYVTSFFSANSKQEKLEKEVAKVAKLAEEHSSDDHERIIFVHDYLIKNAKYDHDGLEEYYQTSHNPSCEYIFSAYGCLVEGDTVCSGYAKAFQLIMTKLGYECTYVTGDAGEAHGWNCMYLDGEGYYIDVTWDDPDYDKEIPYYEYALITSADLNKTHTVDMTFFETPVCNATTYNYYRYNGYFDEEYDFDTAKSILEKQSGNDAMYIRFGSVTELGKAYKDIVENGKYKSISGISGKSQFDYNETHCTLTFIK